jgi:hypothetical protein
MTRKNLLRFSPRTQKSKTYKKGTSNFTNGSKYTTEKKAGYYCTEHGANPTHNTDSCYTLKNKAKKTDDSGSMTKKSFRREINLLSRKRPKKKVLEMFALVLVEERKKASKKQKAHEKAKRKSKSKRKKRVETVSSPSTSSSESDSDTSVNVIETFKSRLRQQRSKKRKVAFDNESDATHESNESPEEKNYKETIQSLGKTKDEEDSPESSTESKE